MATQIVKMPSERPFIKPSSPVIKRLFDFSDPSETKKMFQDMVKSECDRLSSVWNFECRSAFSAGTQDENAGQDDDSASNSTYRRYDWKRQDRKSVPHFYSRPFHIHHSERKNNVVPTCQKKTFSEMRVKDLPLPLAFKNENLTKSNGRKRNAVKSVFTSPPRITSSNVDPSLARFVVALRVPSTTGQENSLDSAASANDMCRPVPASEFKQAQASRQLFEEQSKRKRKRSGVSIVQTKITDLMPLKKARAQNQPKRLTETSSAIVRVDLEEK